MRKIKEVLKAIKENEQDIKSSTSDIDTLTATRQMFRYNKKVYKEITKRIARIWVVISINEEYERELENEIIRIHQYKLATKTRKTKED
jgi:hypothetical protein